MDFFVQDINMSGVIGQKYNLAFFASGYEDRSLNFVNKFTADQFERAFIIKYEGHHEEKFHDILYNQFSFINTCTSDESIIYSILNEYVANKRLEKLKILVEYSSMSRVWYTAIINWARFAPINDVELSFVYCIGEYKDDFTPLLINNIYTLMGYEGSSKHSKTLAIFGLGFDKMAALCVIDRLEPDLVISFVASTEHHDYQKKAADINDEFTKTYGQNELMYFPITSVTNTYRLMSELVTAYVDEFNVVFIPMGPKPHILASILLSSKYPEITQIYVQGARNPAPNVIPTDNFVCTKIDFYRD